LLIAVSGFCEVSFEQQTASNLIQFAKVSQQKLNKSKVLRKLSFIGQQNCQIEFTFRTFFIPSAFSTSASDKFAVQSKLNINKASIIDKMLLD